MFPRFCLVITFFIWQTFVELSGLAGQATLGQLHQDGAGSLNEAEVKVRAQLFGPNVITVKVRQNRINDKRKICFVDA